MERTYYTINELTAKVAKEINSFSGYAEGSATREYQAKVNKVYDIVERIEKEKPHLLEKAERMAERYSRKLAEHLNAYYRNEASCPSVMISGAGNFPVRKKQKQNGKSERIHRFHKKKRSGTFDVVDDTAPLHHHILHGRPVAVHQHHAGNL